MSISSGLGGKGVSAPWHPIGRVGRGCNLLQRDAV